MKISTAPAYSPPYKRLSRMKAGTTVTLKRRLSRDTDTRDPFLLVDMQSYRLHVDDRCLEYCNKVAVLNLANNRLSYIDGDRECLEIDAEVRLA